jgi:hypothetical protein
MTNISPRSIIRISSSSSSTQSSQVAELTKYFGTPSPRARPSNRTKESVTGDPIISKTFSEDDLDNRRDVKARFRTLRSDAGLVTGKREGVITVYIKNRGIEI